MNDLVPFSVFQSDLQFHTLLDELPIGGIVSVELAIDRDCVKYFETSENWRLLNDSMHWEKWF